MKDVTNDIITLNNAEYVPAEININYDRLTVLVSEAVNTFEDIEPIAENYSLIKNERMKANRLKRAIEDKRKDITRNLDEQKKEVMANVKKAIEPLDELINKQNEFLTGVEENNKKIRLDVVRVVFETKAEQAELDKDTFAEHYEEFNKAAFFTPTFKLKKEGEGEIDKIVIEKINEIEKLKDNQEIIIKQCEQHNLLPDPYLKLLENDSLLNVMNQINEDNKKKEELKTLEEQKALEEQKRKEEIEELARTQVSDNLTLYDNETGEVIELPENVVTNLRLTFNSRRQYTEFKNWCLDNHVKLEPLIIAKTSEETSDNDLF